MELQFITTNEGKFREVATVLAAHGVDLSRLDVRYPEVQADTLEEVVSFGLEWLTRRHGGDMMVDDSGLFVEALGGFPGVYSAYVYRTLGTAGILKLLLEGEDRRARFMTVLGLQRGGRKVVLRGECGGTIGHATRGKGGFGFDPIFIPEGHDRTFAEMSVEEKNAVSHRGRAAEALLSHLAVR